MATKKKMLQAAAGNAGGAGLDITEVFSTYLYDGTGAAHTITNGIDLAGEGGLTWIKTRNTSSSAWHSLSDTARGAGYILRSDLTNAQGYDTVEFTSFNSNGFTVGNDAQTNGSGRTYASWTFRKAPKFFTCVEYTGNSTEGRTVSHDLGSVPGVILVKCTSHSGDWSVYHRGLSSPATKRLQLNSTSAEVAGRWNSTLPTSTEFTLNDSLDVNGNGRTFVAYLFAHNDDDGEFGPDGDQDIIKCGSYTGNGSTTGPEIDLGFEPQWVMIKNASSTSNWGMIDVMRGITTGGDDAVLFPDDSSDELGINTLEVTPNGFKVTRNTSFENTSGNTYIYMAIRRGPMAVPEDATDVFAMDTLGSTTPNPPSYNAGFPVDLGIMKSKTSGTDFWRVGARLTGETRLKTNSSEAEATDTQHKFDYQDGWYDAGAYVDSQYQSWMWKRAPGFCDVVAYTGTNIAGLTINHNLGVVPEMIWVKNRSAAEYWAVYHKDLNGGTNPSHYFLRLNTTNAETDYNEIWNDTEPTATQFTVGQQGVVNGAGTNHIAYLFATVPGVSKVGSFTGTGGSGQTIDCGFTSGARFVLIKRTDSSTYGDWYVWDSERGIVAGNDPRLSLNTTSAEVLADTIDPHSSGFSTVPSTIVDQSGASYIFYAIA